LIVEQFLPIKEKEKVSMVFLEEKRGEDHKVRRTSYSIDRGRRTNFPSVWLTSTRLLKRNSTITTRALSQQHVSYKRRDET
jgi:hypothetical protein